MTAAPILISGSGLCGLLVARALATHKIPFIIYERDQSSFQRAQGYRLRMSIQGLDAIQAILPEDAWKQFRSGVATTMGSGMQNVNAINGEKQSDPIVPNQNNFSTDKDEKKDDNKETRERMSGLGPNGEVYGVSRGYLRSSLMKSIEDKVQFGKRITSYTSTSSGVIAHFDDGTSSPEGSLLIGADGVHSYIAKQVSQGALKLFDTQTRMIHGQTSTTAFKALGEGVFAISDESLANGSSVRVICNVRPDDMNDPNITFGWTMVCSPGMIEAPGNKYQVVGKVAADLAKELTSKWHESIKPIFTDQVEEESGFWKMTTSSPEGVPEWKTDPRVTVVGDAVHSMTPAGGNGANTALITASLLGKLLRKSHGWDENVTSTFERQMRQIGTKNVQTSFNMAKARFGIKELVQEF